MASRKDTRKLDREDKKRAKAQHYRMRASKASFGTTAKRTLEAGGVRRGFAGSGRGGEGMGEERMVGASNGEVKSEEGRDEDERTGGNSQTRSRRKEGIDDDERTGGNSQTRSRRKEGIDDDERTGGNNRARSKSRRKEGMDDDERTGGNSQAKSRQGTDGDERLGGDSQTRSEGGMNEDERTVGGASETSSLIQSGRGKGMDERMARGNGGKSSMAEKRREVGKKTKLSRMRDDGNDAEDGSAKRRKISRMRDDDDDDESVPDIPKSPALSRKKKTTELDEDEKQIRKLERKLGVKSKDGMAKLKRGLLEDGFDDDVMNFLKQSDDEGDDDANEIMDDEARDDDLDQNAMYIPSNIDLYGRDDDENQHDSESVSSTTLLEIDPELNSAMRRLLNRTSEETASNTVKELAKLFSSYSSKQASQSFAATALSGSSKATSPLFASLALALEATEPNIVSELLELLVKNIHRDKSDPEQLRLLGSMCASAGCDEALVWSVFDRLLESFSVKVNSFANDPDHEDTPDHARIKKHFEESIVALAESCGWRMRAKDPTKYRSSMLHVSELLGSLRLESHAKNKIDYSPEEDRFRKWKKWLGKEWKDLPPPPPLNVSFADFVDAEKRGRYWIMGAAWNPTMQTKENVDGAAAIARIQRKKNDPISIRLSKASPKLLIVAQRQGMDTDVKRAMFCLLMGGSCADFVDAFDEMVKMNLTDSGERDAVRVILHCCMRCKSYNRFFELLATRLCTFNGRHRFSLQLAIWDSLQNIDENQDRDVRNLARFVSGLVKSFAISLTILKKVTFVKITSKRSVLFLKQFFVDLLCRPSGNAENDVENDDDLLNGGALDDVVSKQDRKKTHEDDLTVAKLFSRLKSSKDGPALKDGILLFWSKTEPFISHASRKTTLLAKRMGVARRVLEHYVGVGADGEEEGFF